MNKSYVQMDESGRHGVQRERECHFRSAKEFYSSLHQNTEVAKRNNHVLTLTLDFQQNLPLPHLPVGDLCICCGYMFLVYIAVVITKLRCIVGQRL